MGVRLFKCTVHTEACGYITPKVIVVYTMRQLDVAVGKIESPGRHAQDDDAIAAVVRVDVVVGRRHRVPC